ncbi:alpha/beta hydrolase [Actinoplanes bogorensis]|uniref:Alpha/beta hydrolase n=1 Tax=Paractinoplanes bogorensis TaxID=1610840 RepID=A0ABS5YNC6_9ACTN|nr:alpha/beta hydrolase [Actinoplanes bogorensis]MBU2664816.1 alpha/beta hydrolase [Actinoplanes bogorensis]
MTIALTRRTLLTATLAAGVAVPLSTGPAVAAVTKRLTLPRPTGPHRIGTVAQRLRGGNGRDVMASIWYPAADDGRRYPRAPWMPAASYHALFASVDLDAAEAPLTAGLLGAPPLPAGEGRPVVVYSHGNNSCRAETTIVVQELASHGYVVATVDHTGDGYSEFPGGQVTTPDDEEFNPWNSAYDVRALLDHLQRLRGPLGATIDMRRVGMYGWSKGATSTALVMNEDRRVRAGIGFDGEMQSQPRPTTIDRPFMIMSAEFPRSTEESVEEFWQNLRGWRLNIQARGAAHSSYIDTQWLIPQIAPLIGMTPEDYAAWCGTLDPGRGVRIQQAYPLAFFDQHLRGRRQRLLEGPSRAFPEVTYLP